MICVGEVSVCGCLYVIFLDFGKKRVQTWLYFLKFNYVIYLRPIKFIQITLNLIISNSIIPNSIACPSRTYVLQKNCFPCLCVCVRHFSSLTMADRRWQFIIRMRRAEIEIVNSLFFPSLRFQHTRLANMRRILSTGLHRSVTYTTAVYTGTSTRTHKHCRQIYNTNYFLSA